MSTAIRSIVFSLVPAIAGLVPLEPLTAPELENLWADLTTKDPVIAQRAITGLAGKSEDAVAFLEKRLRPVCRPEPKRLARLIADLDSREFKAREGATQELERLGETAEAALREALSHRPSPEARRRIERVLETHKRERLHPPPNRMRLARAVEVLEQINNPAARRLLAALAHGAPEAPLTREAKGALERLAKQSAPGP
jgi:hypothetical protein